MPVGHPMSLGNKSFESTFGDDRNQKIFLFQVLQKWNNEKLFTYKRQSHQMDLAIIGIQNAELHIIDLYYFVTFW